MEICPDTACFKEVPFYLSPNRNERPEGPQGVISLLVIHNISLPPGEFGGKAIQDFFLNQLDINAHPYYQEIELLKVSAHLFIDRQGQVTQFVPFNERAWHAGISSFGERENCNDFSIGIELEGTDEAPYTPEQYHSLNLCTKAIMITYPGITLENIVGHSDIAPERKTDPGPYFDWTAYKMALATEPML
jgi:AmpD protein